MVKASAAFVRIRIRVPEAYLLIRPLDTSRPGLLVLDADGRRVDSIALPGMGAPRYTYADLSVLCTQCSDHVCASVSNSKSVGSRPNFWKWACICFISASDRNK